MMRPRHKAGVTLIELLVCLAVLSVLLPIISVSYISMLRHVGKTRRQVQLLMDVQQAQRFIVRDVRDTVVSLAHYTSWRQKKPFSSELDRIVHNTQWLHFCNAWQPAAGAIVRYEDLSREPQQQVKDVVAKLDVPVTVKVKQLPQFNGLHKSQPLFFRRGKIGDWPRFLSKEQEGILWEQFGWKMEELGYER